VRIARAADREAMAALYRAWGYDGGIKEGDVVFVAERDRPVGIVRRSWEEGDTLMLRGMWVAPEHRGDGIGSALLAAFVRELGDDPSVAGHACWGVPFAHLERFYGQGGFVFVPVATAPSFIRERIARYEREGHRVAVMRRDP
jgi:GNAT superfamily N-acetyltransferase